MQTDKRHRKVVFCLIPPKVYYVRSGAVCYSLIIETFTMRIHAKTGCNQRVPADK